MMKDVAQHIKQEKMVFNTEKKLRKMFI